MMIYVVLWHNNCI